MAYNITLSNGQNLVTVENGTIDTNYSSLTLIGKNFPGYGEFINENNIRLLENFANSTSPPNPLTGQLWWDSTNKIMKVYTGSNWKTVSSSTSSTYQPTNPVTGDSWWDTSNGQMKVWGGAEWLVIGPSYTAAQQQTGSFADVVTEVGGGAAHVIVKFFVKNTCVAVLSKDPSFTVASLTGFTVINPGFNLSSIGNLGYYGNSYNALNLGGVLAEKYLRNDQNGTITGSLAIQSASGLTIGSGVNGVLTLDSTTIDTKIRSRTEGKDLKFYVNYGGVETNMLTLNAGGAGISPSVTVGASPTSSSSALTVATKGYIDSILGGAAGNILAKDGSIGITGSIVPASNAVYDFGSASSAFNRIYATQFVGTATNSTSLGGATADKYVRTDALSPISSPVIINNNNGLAIGPSSDFTIDITASPNAVNLKSNTAGKMLNMMVNVGGNPTTALSISQNNGLITVVGNPQTDLGIATKQYVDNAVGASVNLTAVNTNIIPVTNGAYSVGTSSARFTDMWATTFHGNATSANYADLAERFEADAEYEPGTLVKIGGNKEITIEDNECSNEVFGVISSKPAYLMNEAAGTNKTHPAVALAGRVHVKVIGKVSKGKRLVSAGNGVAREAVESELSSLFIIGRALENKVTDEVGMVESVVRLNG